MSQDDARDTHVAVSDERLEVMRRWADSWNRVDLDAFADLYDVNAELITDPSWMEAGPISGRAAIRGWYEGLKESWEGRDAVALTDLCEVGDKLALASSGRFAEEPASLRWTSTPHASTTSIN